MAVTDKSQSWEPRARDESFIARVLCGRSKCPLPGLSPSLNRAVPLSLTESLASLAGYNERDFRNETMSGSECNVTRFRRGSLNQSITPKILETCE